MSRTTEDARPPAPCDAVSLKRELQVRVAGETAGLSVAERLAWFQQRIAASEFADFLAKPPTAAPPSAP